MNLNKRHLSIMGIVTLALLCSAVAVSCKGKKTEVKPVKGVLEEPVREGTAPEKVLATLDRHVLDQNFEMILNDTVNNVHVWSLVRCDSTTSSEGFGIVVAKDGRATIFADIRHGRYAEAHFNKASGTLWFTGISIEGTGTQVERFYQIGFRDDGPHYVVATIDPYEMQQALIKELKYSIKGNVITLFNGEKELAKVTNTVKDMGDFYDDAVWLGEQIQYNINHDELYVLAQPGVSFVTGKVLHYDDMPAITARVNLNSDGSFTLSNINATQSSY